MPSRLELFDRQKSEVPSVPIVQQRQWIRNIPENRRQLSLGVQLDLIHGERLAGGGSYLIEQPALDSFLLVDVGAPGGRAEHLVKSALLVLVYFGEVTR